MSLLLADGFAQEMTHVVSLGIKRVHMPMPAESTCLTTKYVIILFLQARSTAGRRGDCREPPSLGHLRCPWTGLLTNQAATIVELGLADLDNKGTQGHHRSGGLAAC